MSRKRNFSIGITINLDNYENLRLDVGGEIEKEQDAEELIGFLDQVLSRLGRGNKETAQRVDSYRNRIFTLQKEERIPAVEPVQEVKPAVPKKEPPEEKVQARTPAPPAAAQSPAPAAPAPKRSSEPAGQPAAPAVKKAEPSPPKPPAAAPASAALAEFICEECQAPVSKGQNQMSQLFTGRTLCKKCMKSP